MTVMTSWDLFDDLRAAQDELLRMTRAYGQRLTPAGQFVQQFDTGSGAQAWAPRGRHLRAQGRLPGRRGTARRRHRATWRSPSRTAC